MTTQETQPAQAMVQRCASKPVAWRFAYCGCDKMVWLHEPPNDPIFANVTPLYEHPPSAQAAAAGEVPVWLVENQRLSFDYDRPNWLFRQETKQPYGKPPINVFGWTNDPAKALRFPRKQDAEDALLIASCYVADGPTFKHAFVSEHIFHEPDQAALKAQGGV